MTAGFFAPLPPAPSGVADHAAHLLEALRTRGTVEVEPRHSPVNVYHLGNNHLHAGIYRRALAEPGIAVLHDAVLHHFLLGSLSRDAYIEEFEYNYGVWTRDLAADLWSGRSRSAADARYFAYPMLKRIAEGSRAVIVHNPAAAAMVREHSPAARVFEVPLLFWRESAPDDAAVQAARARFGIAPTGLLCGIFGHLRESKRIHTAIRACRAAGVPLLLAGAMPSDLERALAPHLKEPGVHWTGPAPADEFALLSQAVDVCINLKYPAAGETSAIGVGMMGTGKTVLMSDAREISRYPEDTCLRIESGVREEAHLTLVLAYLRKFPSEFRQIGARAASYITSRHAPERVAELYWEAIRSVS